MKRAYVTLLSSSSYILGVLGLYRSLQKYGKTKFPFLCVCSQCMAVENLTLLKDEGIDCLMLEHSALDGVNLPNSNQGYEHWTYTFDKLLLWGLTAYDKLVFLDSDMMVLSNIDDLFDKPPMSAVQAGFLLHNDWNRLNSGLMVIEPNVEVRDRLLSQLPVTIQSYNDAQSGVGDQDVINDVFPNWSNEEELHLLEGYNLFFKHLTIYHKRFGFQMKDIKVVHFIGKQKPWYDNGMRKVYSLIRQLIHNPYGCRWYWRYQQLL